MNYIRGAVNAISAPYQYYKELPPINPSTLTGAIDVLVIQRPTDNGDTELACTPFHVRFGKWQVLRPAEKKVNVLVNGKPIPFNMKIGDAGEAFFVFETDDDVPADLITSPILHPTEPSADKTDVPVQADFLTAKQLHGPLATNEPQITLTSNTDLTRVEPDFLDLNGKARDEEDVRTTPKQNFIVPHALRKSGSKATINQSSALSLPSPPPSREPSSEREVMDEQDLRVDAALKSLGAQAHVPTVGYLDDLALDMEGYKSVNNDREGSQETTRSSDDSSHSNLNQQFQFSGILSSSFSRPSSPPSSNQPSNMVQSAIPSPYTPSLSPSPSPSPLSSPSTQDSIYPFSFRATSEPPPECEEERSSISISLSTQDHSSPQNLHLQEYSWEWGAFPQPSPLKPSFGKGGRMEFPKSLSSSRKRKGFGERKGRMLSMILPPSISVNGKAYEEDDGLKDDLERISCNDNGLVSSGRSKSVPPHFAGNPATKGRRGSREYKEYEDVEEHEQEESRGRTLGEIPWDGILAKEVEKNGIEKKEAFGVGGTLSSCPEDPSTLILSIEGKKIPFQLSLLSTFDHNCLLEKGMRKKVDGNVLSKDRRQLDEFEIAQQFEYFRVDWTRFLKDETVVSDPSLVIKWAGTQYISRNDGSPLLDALVRWRSSSLTRSFSERAISLTSPPSPTMESMPSVETTDQQRVHLRATSEPPSIVVEQAVQAEEDTLNKEAQTPGVTKKPTSSSWVQWWSRSRQKDAAVASNEAKSYALLDPKRDSSTSSLPILPKAKIFPEEKPKIIASGIVKTGSAPTTPVQRPVEVLRPSLSMHAGRENETTPPRALPPSMKVAAAPQVRKYAKTLRLTSDQLKSLNLRPGPNSITFSLSASGAVAATARIFVWDSKDLVVISDIDGTITKSDGLGHVFAMIGRDWTHVGVAKLYSDITRNGYKIMYLTSRAIGQADATRDYLKGIKQNNYQLPEGPVIMSPDRLMASLHREVIMRKPEVFKMACLRDIQRLFGESARNPFYAGFGNRITDALSYRSVNVPSARIFTIDTTGEVKMELLELAGYKSSYIHMTDLVDQMFPPMHRKWTPEFTDFNYWKTPVQKFPLPDFSPPSPALSARSDTSNQSALARLRNFSLGGSANHSRLQLGKQSSISKTADGLLSGEDYFRDSHLRQMTSFEKLKGFMTRANNQDSHRRSMSPETSSSYAGSDEEEDENGERVRRSRRRSMVSMPGSLDDMHFGVEDDDELRLDDDVPEDGDDDDHQYHDGNDVDESVEEAFDDDLLAAGEMQNVPFL